MIPRVLMPGAPASPILAAMAARDMTMQHSFRPGDRVFLRGDTDHPAMTVLGRQLDLFERDQPARVLCTWRARGKDGRTIRRYGHFDPARIHPVSGLAEEEPATGLASGKEGR